MNWTDERVELLTKLWAEGLSASQIAAQLGGVSRNAVIGKVHRLKLSGRGKTTKAQPRAAKSATQTSAPVVEETAKQTASSAAPRATRPAAEKPAPRVEPIASEARPRKTEATSTMRAAPQTEREPRPQTTFSSSSVKVDFSANAAADFDASLADSNIVPMKRNLTLLQLTESTCKWPIGDPLNEDFHFCGADSGESSPYCSFHSKIAFQPISDRRRVRA
ncbi:GcrA cell cycle regulator [Bartonella sp. HY329]|uniref:GcrA family cell cycle regulator n=1 Tax=unclassified Bartonella TaxID=2645622 RepID=UPI0021C852EB|nr:MULTISPECIES: GcrA family cell cycle regulator [unclassified Bartonella]UXM94781.1 GcrA cell cycle regulator [Bartonella sp. HY329]UXN09104.1 GcrA cell cycle regulator [Bartonella sp. HY328]